ncbi:hypothetical protein [Paenibacillus koleovorans]|uniref:hypothetical protein n=1 Tax=Paenibacillus koleovorans TaxID=121608 RepID=UPI000FDB681D|nr:hypothetical protein [Paenibacillus koleovorans]
MSEQILQQILEELKDIKREQQEMKKHVAEIPFIKQALIETLEITRNLESSQRAFESKVAADYRSHDISIKMLAERQFKLEVEFEAIKNR